MGRGFEWGLGRGAAGSFLALVPGGLEGQRGKWVGGESRRWRGQSLGWEDLLKKGKATHSSILAWRIPWTV